MSDYVLSCESTVDLTPEKIHELGLECIYFHFYIDGVEYPDDLGQTIPFDKFYQAMKDGAETKTAAIGTGEYEKFLPLVSRAGKGRPARLALLGHFGHGRVGPHRRQDARGRVSRAQDPCH